MNRKTKSCWYCKEPWTRQHKCRTGRTLHILQDIEDDTEDPEQLPQELQTEQHFHTAPNTPTPDNVATTQLMAISTQAATGLPGKSTFSLLVTIAGKRAVALVDSGSSDTFISNAFVEKHNILTAPTQSAKVAVAGGSFLTSDGVVAQTKYKVQGHTFQSSFRVLPLKTFDIVLGTDWIYEYSPIGLDLKRRELVVTKNGTPIKLLDHTKHPHVISAMHMSKLCQKGVLGYLLHIAPLIPHTEEAQEELPDRFNTLLEFYKDVFQAPAGLPPQRECDHHIFLEEGVKPPNLRPYRVPHYQKDAMEAIIRELLDNEEIRHSISPFSSPAVMVRKKDGGWRLCVWTIDS